MSNEIKVPVYKILIHPSQPAGAINLSGAESGFSYPAKDVYLVDLNRDGIDEIFYGGFETQPNSPSDFTLGRVAIFGWKEGALKNLTQEWIPTGQELIEACGDLAVGDFDGNGFVDLYLTAYTDMDHSVSPVVFYNDGTRLTKSTLAKSVGEHGVAAYDVNFDGFVDVLPVYNTGVEQYILLGSKTGLKRYTLQAPEGVLYTREGNDGSGIAIGNFFGNGTPGVIITDNYAVDGLSDNNVYSLIRYDSPSGYALMERGALPKSRLDLLIDAGSIRVPDGYRSHDIRARAIDLNGDALSDVMMMSNGSISGYRYSQIQFYENLGSGNFRDVTTKHLAGYPLESQITYNPLFQDVNNDGLMDIYVAASVWEKDAAASNAVLLNMGGAIFEDSFRKELSQFIGQEGAGSVLTRGPDGEMYLVRDIISFGGKGSVSFAKVEFLLETMSAGEDLVEGTVGNDWIVGDEHDQAIRMTAGLDRIEAFNGFDLLLVNGQSGQYELTFSSEGFELTKGLERTYRSKISGVERLDFSDRSVIIESAEHGDYGDVPEDLYRFFVVAFDAAPGVTYFDQLAQAYRSGMSVKEIVDVFISKDQFTSRYEKDLTVLELSERLVQNIVKDGASLEVKRQAVEQIEAAFKSGMSRGDVIFEVFGNLAEMPFTDPVWGGVSRLLANEVSVSRAYTELMSQSTTDIDTLRSVLSVVTKDSQAQTDELAIELAIEGMMGGDTPVQQARTKLDFQAEHGWHGYTPELSFGLNFSPIF